MAEPEPDQHAQRERRGLFAPTIRRGVVAKVVIKTLRLVRQLSWRAFELLLALIIVFEEWGWRPLSALIARLAELRPIARLEMRIRALPPWPTLGVFLLPSLLFLPLKLAALWLIGGGHVLSATLLFAFAKVVGTALYARIFQLTQPRLMELAWFARLYNWFIPWKEVLVAQAKATRVWQAAAALKARAKIAATETWHRLRPSVTAMLARLKTVLGR